MKLIGGKLFGRSRRLNGTGRKRNKTPLTAECWWIWSNRKLRWSWLQFALGGETLIIEGNIGGVIRAQLPSNGKFTWGSVRKLIERCR
ncbi:MAG: hypothetical protein ACTS6A_00570 [Candidatus Hodgkinia cicadicola]